jgi:hypothetical protein
LSFEHGLSGKPLRGFPDHAWANFLLAVAANATVYTPSRLAGVLLGKTSPNSLYGEQGGLPQTVSQFRPLIRCKREFAPAPDKQFGCFSGILGQPPADTAGPADGGD